MKFPLAALTECVHPLRASFFYWVQTKGNFHVPPASSGVFSDAERRRLIELGLEMTDPYDQQAVEERLLAYQSLSAARERLYVCHTRSNGEGGSQTGSVIVSELNRLFPHCIRFDADEEDALARVEGESPAFLLTASRWGKSDPLSAALKRYFRLSPGLCRQACRGWPRRLPYACAF